MRTIPLCLLACLPMLAQAQGVPPNVFVQALQQGRAVQALADPYPYGQVIRAIQATTRDSGPVVITAVRTEQFLQQPHCGRVAFAIAQPSSHVVWPELGGQLNVCASGSPPLRVCDDKPEALVLPDTRCKDGSRARDTSEVLAAMQRAVAGGSLSAEQFRQRLTGTQPTNPDAADRGLP